MVCNPRVGIARSEPSLKLREGLLPLAGLAALASSVGSENGLAALGEGNLDQVEVARGDDGLEHFPCLLQHLADMIPRGDVDQGEELDFGLARDGGGLNDGRVAGLGG